MKNQPFPLYHWSPVDRRKQILRYGLRPNMRSRCGMWRPPYVCFSDSPSMAWGLSGALSDEPGEWDLWMMWSNEPSGFEALTTGNNRSGKPTEFRVYERVFKRSIWHVGVRNHQSFVSDEEGYALFAGHVYYPEGGSKDFRGFGSIQELKKLYHDNIDRWAEEAGSTSGNCWGEILDPKTMRPLLCEGNKQGWAAPETQE